MLISQSVKKVAIIAYKKLEFIIRTNIHGPGLEDIPVKCPQKAQPRKQIKDVLSHE